MPKTKDGRDYERKVVRVAPGHCSSVWSATWNDSGRPFSQVTRQALQEFLKNHGYGPALEGWK